MQRVNSTKDVKVFQNDINAVYGWFVKLYILFNEKNLRLGKGAHRLLQTWYLTSLMGRKHWIRIGVTI